MKKWILVLLAFIGVLALVIIILIVKSSYDKLDDIGFSSNVDSVKNSCDIACSNNNSYDYCYQMREVNDRKNSKFSDTCYNLVNSDNYSHRSYDIPKCPQINCSVAG